MPRVTSVPLRSYYENYISNVEEDLKQAVEKRDEIVKLRKRLYATLYPKVDDIFRLYNIDLTKYTDEWIDKKYSESEALYQRVHKCIKNTRSSVERELLIVLLKYCQTLKREFNIENLIDVYVIKKNLTYTEYHSIIKAYAKRIQIYLLEAKGYKFGYGIGTLIICYWKANPDLNKKNYIDYNESRKRKNELLAQGKELWNEDEYKRCLKYNIPYNGVKYLVYRQDTSFFEITLLNTRLFRTKELKMIFVEGVNAKYIGLGYKEIADEYVKELEDIYSLPINMRYKLNILTYKYPDKYLNFVRNEKGYKLQC